jgi:outer membrane protein
MKKIILTLLMTGLISSAMAQKYGYVDTEYILNNIPEYEAAQKQLNQLAEDWKKQVDAKFQEVQKLYEEYQAEKALMSDEMKRKKEEEIMNAEEQARQLQEKYFGTEGDLGKKREELVKPIQDQVFNAVKELAEEGNFAVIFDTAGGASMLYTDPKFDYSDEVLKKLGYGE